MQFPLYHASDNYYLTAGDLKMINETKTDIAHTYFLRDKYEFGAAFVNVRTHCHLDFPLTLHCVIDNSSCGPISIGICPVEGFISLAVCLETLCKYNETKNWHVLGFFLIDI